MALGSRHAPTPSPPRSSRRLIVIVSSTGVRPPTAPDARAIQGSVIGFNKDHQRLVFLHFNDVASARGLIGALEPNIASGYEVREFNDLYKEVRAHRGGEKGIIEASWTNMAF